MASRNLAPFARGAGIALAALLLARTVVRRQRRLDLNGKRVLITGGSRGLGFAAARRFLSEGADVVICARDAVELARAEKLLREHALERSKRTGRLAKVLALRADVSDEQATAALVAQTLQALGGLDVLVNCAVSISIGPLEALTTGDFEHAFRGIFFALYQPTMAVLPHMRVRGFGRIVNVTSVAGKVPIPHSGSYVAGKFAATGFSQVSASELRKYGIRVSTVMPPPLRNGAWLNAGYKGAAEEELAWFARALHSRLTSADPERAARAIVDAARYGDVEKMVAPTAWLQSRLHALLPGVSVTLTAWLERRLPKSPPGARAIPAVSGEEIMTLSDNPAVIRVGRRARRAAESYLQPVAAKLR